MSVYKEGYSTIRKITSQSVQIYSDACDYGAPVKVGDILWNDLIQLVEFYGVEGTKTKDKLGCSVKVFLMDEWAVSDERKTVKEAEEFFMVSYNKCDSGACKDFDGYITIEKLNS